MSDQDDVRRVLLQALDWASDTSEHFSSRDVAQRAVSNIHRSTMREMAIRWLTDEVDRWRRGMARSIETRAAVRKELRDIGTTPEQELMEERAEQGRERSRRAYERTAAELREHGRPLSYDERSDNASQALGTAFEQYKQSVVLEVTSELLASDFALGDGTRATWGAATVEQHQQRVEMLQKKGFSTLETAARHAAAIRMIRASGVATLGETQAAAEAA